MLLVPLKRPMSCEKSVIHSFLVCVLPVLLRLMTTRQVSAEATRVRDDIVHINKSEVFSHITDQVRRVQFLEQLSRALATASQPESAVETTAFFNITQELTSSSLMRRSPSPAPWPLASSIKLRPVRKSVELDDNARIENLGVHMQNFENFALQSKNSNMPVSLFAGKENIPV